MTTTRTRTAALLATAVLGLPLIASGSIAPAVAEPHPVTPIAVEPLTPRSSFTDPVSLKLKLRGPGRQGTQVVKMTDLSRIVTARITVQPGAMFPLHVHPGPVFVTVVEGELTYVDPHTCVERVYPAGTAFVDSGADVHSAYGSSSDVTTLMATFLGVPAEGPLTVTERVHAPTRCQLG